MRILGLAFQLMLAAAACTATPAAPATAAGPSATEAPPSFRWYRTGEVLFIYHQVRGDCDTLVRLTCLDGSACMREGALSTAADPVSEHAIPFGTMALARQYTQQVAALKTACQLPN